MDKPAVYIELDDLRKKGYELVESSKYDEAIACFKKVIESDPRCVIANVYIGFALVESQMYIEALEFFDRAIELDNNDPEAYYHKASALRHLLRFEEAIDALIKPYI